MKAVEITRPSPYSARALYDLVADVERYPEFLPYCEAVRLFDHQTSGDKSHIQAEVSLRYKMLHYVFTNGIYFNPTTLEIRAMQSQKPLRHLDARWHFIPRGEGCEIVFYLDFALSSLPLRHLLRPLEGRLAERFIALFEARADELYASSRQD